MKKIIAYIGVFSLIILLPLLVGIIADKDERYVFVEKAITGAGDMAYATFYRWEPMGTRMIKDSDQIIRSNFDSLRNHFGLEHEMKTSPYPGSTDYAVPGTAGHHAEGSARLTVDSSSPSSNEEGRLWVDSDTFALSFAGTEGVWLKMTTAEVITARGSMATLTARLDVELAGTGASLAAGSKATLNDFVDVQHNEDGTLKGPIDMNDTKITELATPTQGTDAATKSYADSIVGAGGNHAASHFDGTDDLYEGVFPAVHYDGLGNTDGIQEAINAANSNGGGTVQISAGTHVTANVDLTLYSNITLRGDGETIIQSGDGDQAVKIEGSLGSAYTTTDAIMGRNGITCTTPSEAGNFAAGDLAVVSGSEEASLYIVNSSNDTSGSVTFQTGLVATYTDAPTIKKATVVENVVIKGIHFVGWNLSIIGGKDIIVKDTEWEGASATGIGTSNAYNVRVLNSYLHDLDTGAGGTEGYLDLGMCQNCIAMGNTIVDIKGSDMDGVHMDGGWMNKVIGNTISGGEYGIHSEDSSFGVISDNIIETMSDDAIYLTASSDSNTVVGNVLPYGVIDNDGSGNRGGGNVYLTCEGCDQPNSW